MHFKITQLIREGLKKYYKKVVLGHLGGGGGFRKVSKWADNFLPSSFAKIMRKNIYPLLRGRGGRIFLIRASIFI